VSNQQPYDPYSSTPTLKYLVFGSKIPPLAEPKISFPTFGTDNKSFAEYYNQEIYPKAVEIEQDRVETLKKFKFRFIIALIVMVAAIALTIKYSEQILGFQWQAIRNGKVITPSCDGNHNFLLLFIIVILPFIWSFRVIAKYESLVKAEIYPLIFKFFGNFEYKEESDIDIGFVNSFDILPSYDMFLLENTVNGVYNDINLHLTYATLQKRNNADRKIVYAVFTGLFIFFTVNKKFNGKTIVRSKANDSSMFMTHLFEKLQPVTLEDPEFNERFAVFSTDQVEARYLLSTSFMQRLLDMTKMTNGSQIQCGFFNNNLFLMLPTKEKFFEESSILIPATFTEDITHIIEQMSHICAITDYLKLTDKSRL
jgi:hypothetical protein